MTEIMQAPDAVVVPASRRTGTFYVAATPLGNLGDISNRLSATLAEADAVFAEDTRRTRTLLSHLGLNRPLFSLHEHNEDARGQELVDRVTRGEQLVLVSDAGTPGVSDPGSRVVSMMHEAGLRVCPIVGPSALTGALSVAGFETGKEAARFYGFLPRDTKERTAKLDELMQFTGVAVLYESPHRLAALLETLSRAEPGRMACVCRELTKLHEEVRRASLEALAEWAKTGGVRGEITLVLASSQTSADDVMQHDIEKAVSKCLKAGLSSRDSALATAILLGVSKKTAYAYALAASR